MFRPYIGIFCKLNITYFAPTTSVLIEQTKKWIFVGILLSVVFNSSNSIRYKAAPTLFQS